VLNRGEVAEGSDQPSCAGDCDLVAAESAYSVRDQPVERGQPVDDGRVGAQILIEE
jgi:hypothetical protein